MSNTPIFSFGVISDVQYAKQSPNWNAVERPTTLSLGKLDKALNDINQEDLAFIIHLGDLIDRDPRNFPAAFAGFSKAKAPVKYVLGNHDFYDTEYKGGLIDSTLEAYGITRDERYYYFDSNGYRFFVLDSNEVGTVEYPVGSPDWEIG